MIPSGELLEITIPCALLVTALLLVTAALLTTVATTLPQANANTNTLSSIKTVDDAKVESKDDAITISPPRDSNVVYYHITTTENAEKIMSSGMMFGSVSEGGYVFAWKTIPSKKAMRESGAHGDIIISFTTSAAFENDPAFDYSSHAYKYLPVRTVFPGPIRVNNVKIVGK